MYLFKRTAELKRFLQARKREGQTVGFVPTMGALHQGHASLLRQAAAATNCTVCSIFVNPTQFNEATDLLKYPRTPEKDMALLLENGCSVLFLPDVQEVYPDGQLSQINLDFHGLDQRMEGAHRPGHFAGVAQVVKRLLDIVEPHQLFLGQKDFQQFVIVRHMVEALGLPIKLTRCATVREEDGLAMSSRNSRLSAEQRVIAPIIFKTLQEVKRNVTNKSPASLRNEALEDLNEHGLKPEYFEIIDGKTLQPVESFDDHQFVIACTAVRLGEVRLIDNLVLKGG